VSKKTNNVNEFLNTLKGKVIGAVCAIIVVFFMAKWDYVVDTFNYGAKTKADIELNEKVDKRVRSVMFTDSIMDKFLEQDKVQQFVQKVRVDAMKDAYHNDSSKVKISAKISAHTGMTTGASGDTIASMVVEWMKTKGFVNNSQCIRNSKEYGRGRNVMKGI